jgi:hypothetical protein
MRRRWILLAALLLVATPAAADADEVAPAIAAADGARARAAMTTYFEGEIRGGYVLIGLGVAGVVAGGALYRKGTPTARGASYPLLGVGLAHAVAGIYVGIASHRRIDSFSDQIERDPSAFVAAESERMAGVSRTFTALKVVELVLVGGGLAAAGVGWRTDRPRLRGAGLALALEATLTLGFDVVAAQRATRYRDGLADAHVAVWLDPAGDGAGAAIAGRF